MIVLAPASVQEMADFVDLAFELSFKYRNPAMILSDGVIGQMMEKLVPPRSPRCTEEEIRRECPLGRHGSDAWRKPQRAYVARPRQRAWNKKNLHLQAKYKEIKEKEVPLNPSCAMMQSI